jgi:hypothetical protein
VVEVNYNLRGREWKSPEGVTKYFNTVEAWSISLSSNANVEQLKKTFDLENNDDLPF